VTARNLERLQILKSANEALLSGTFIASSVMISAPQANQLKPKENQIMSKHESEIRELDKKITALSDALAHLGKGTTMQDLILIIRKPGYTTPAELRFTVAMVDAMHDQVNILTQLGNNLLAGAKAVGEATAAAKG
jgi:uncharacterized protein YukE